MLRLYYLVLSLLLVINNSDAQNSKSCVAHKHFEQKLNADPNLQLSYDKLQNEINNYLSSNNKDQEGNVIIIPIVFHILHNGDPIGVQENISEDLILAQLQQLNEDFARMNADAISTPVAFLPFAANTEIQFCLADVDEIGNSTTGIIRTHIDDLTNVNETDCWTPSYIDANIIAPLIWDRNSYLNIFSVIGVDELSNGTCDFFATLGYAQFPGGTANTDAVVVSFYTFGSLQMPNPLFPNYLGRTCTHEVGHWLNLNHVWGGGSGGCNQDDGISDTPQQFENTNGCPTFPFLDNCTASGDGIMFMNYMDYSDDNCMNLFTAGQRGMMRASVFNLRTSLLSSPCEQESVLSIPSQIQFIVENDENGNLLNWQIESDITVKRFEIKKGIDPIEVTNYHIINDCESNADIYNCSFLDSNIYAINYYQIMAHLKNSAVISSDIEVINSQLPISKTAIFPSIVSGDLNISNLNLNQVYKVDIYSNIGQLISKYEINNDRSFIIDVSHIENAIYYLKISSDQEYILKRFVKI